MLMRIREVIDLNGVQIMRQTLNISRRVVIRSPGHQILSLLITCELMDKVFAPANGELRIDRTFMALLTSAKDISRVRSPKRRVSPWQYTAADCSGTCLSEPRPDVLYVGTMHGYRMGYSMKR